MNNPYSNPYNQYNNYDQQGYDNIIDEQQYYDEYGGEIDNGGYNEQEEVEVPILQEGQWSEHSTIASPGIYDIRKSRDQISHSVVSLQYDPYREMLWSGYESGRTSSYKVNTLTSHEWRSIHVDPIQRYSSFQASEEKNCQVIPLNEYVLSVGEKCIRMHSDGGMCIGKFKAPELCNDISIGVSSSTGSFSCATLFRSPNHLMTSDDIDIGPTHIIAGTNSRYVHGYDIRHINAIGADPIVSFDTQAPTTCIQTSASGLHIICGGNDGKIRLLDGRLKTQRIQHTLDAHSGPLLDMCVQPDGVMMMTCGLISRVVNTYDKNSPVTYVADPLVRVFDLRMNRQLPPIAMSMSNPIFAKFIPANSDNDRATPRIVLGGSSGIIQVCAINPERGMEQNDVQILYVPLADRREKVSAIAISSSGEFISAGTTNGHISQYSICKGYNAVEEGLELDAIQPTINNPSYPLIVPPLKADPPLYSMSVDANVVGTAYMIRPKAVTNEPLLSSFLSTPKLNYRQMKFKSNRRFQDVILSKVVWQDYIGTTSNPGYKANSLLFGSNVKKIFKSCDPRKKLLENQANSSNNNNNNNNNTDVEVQKLFNIPKRFQRVQSHRGKQRMNQFNYTEYNRTTSIGLENNYPNSYTNPILQFLYEIPEITLMALNSQTSKYHHTAPTTLWCELGFLYHMMYGIQMNHIKKLDQNNAENYSNYVSKVVTPANFQRTFQQVPEAVALSLFDGSLTDLQLIIQTFARFLFQQLQSEFDQEYNGHSKNSVNSNIPTTNTTVNTSAVEYVFGHSVVTSTTFTQSGTIEIGSPNRAFSVELVYPPITKGTMRSQKEKKEKEDATKRMASGDPSTTLPPYVYTPPSFSSVLWGSLQKESFNKGYCAATTDYERFKQVRSLLTLPRILNLQCGDTQKDPKETTISGALGEAVAVGSMHTHYWSHKNSNGGLWLPIELEIAILKGNFATKQSNKLIISSRLIHSKNSKDSNNEQYWIVFDGKTETIQTSPASINIIDNNGWDISTYNLMAVVSQISEENVGESKHSILHMNTKSRKNDVMKSRASSILSEDSNDNSRNTSRSNSNINLGNSNEEWQWFLYNDFAITPSSAVEAGTFEEWRHPCMICYRRSDYENECLVSSLLDMDISLPVVPSSVLSLPSLSQTPSIRLPTLTSLPGKGDLIAFDGEFVSVEVERSEVNSEGKRVVSEEGRQVLARSSLVDGGEASNTSRPIRILADDCILQTETVADYVTRFSGLTAEDLSFLSSRFSVVSNRTAYLKLRFFIDRGCLFVGHGLQKDFETANVFVPPDQIRDTVELWRLPNQRKVSLRFLAAYVIKEYIQGEIHDSIEDAKTALLLYRHYETLLQTKGQAYITQILNELYAYGNSCNWIATDEI